MKKLLLLIIVFASLIATAQPTLVAPVNPPRIFPRWTGGDRDYWGHGPKITGDIRVVVTEGRSQIMAFINLELKETEGDGSAARIDETRLIYSAPAGKQIRAITSIASDFTHFESKLAVGGTSRVNPAVTNGPVSHLIVLGDTGGPDIGNNTDDDTHVRIIFKGLVVDLEPLATGVREISLPKALLGSTIQGKLRNTRGKLNTYGPRVGDSWFKSRDSWIKFPSDIRADTMFFDQMREVLISPRRYNYNDINLTTIRGDANGQYIRLTVNWESDGPEFRGECVNDVGCMFGSPTVQLNDFKIKINVRPFVAAGRLTYDPNDIQVEFGYNYSADCGILSALCTEVFKDPVLNAFFQARFMLAGVLAERTTVDQISAALNDGVLQYVRTLGAFPTASQIVDVRDAGTNLIVRVR
jgi:hypothetical protein